MSIWNASYLLPIVTLSAKDARLLLRDTRAGAILFLMPLVLILVLGISLGEGFGQTTDEKLRISIVNLDEGLPPDPGPFPGRPWSQVVIDDLSNTADIRVELIPDRHEAERLVSEGQRAGVLIFEPDFSRRVHQCSFLSETIEPNSINPFFRDGVSLRELHVTLLRDERQQVTGSILEQVCQVTLLRVVMPWMIGKAFDRVGDAAFMKRMGEMVQESKDVNFLLKRAMGDAGLQKALGPIVQASIQKMFDRYNLTAKTWADLTKQAPRPVGRGEVSEYHGPDGTGFLKRGAIRYQILVPTYLVMFAFFLVLTVGWLFVAERRQGTMIRLRAAPLTRGQILLGKLIPCLAVSLFQGGFLLLAGKIIFGMSWGQQPLLLLAVVASTSVAAMGLAMLVAGVAKTETQVAIYGTLLVLVLAGLSGSLMPRDLMPDAMKEFSKITPHAWALEAYSQLLTSSQPNLAFVGICCVVLVGFGMAFLMLAWWLLDLEE